MTRGLHPPDSLSAEDIMTLAAVRKDIYMSAAQGLVLGSASGYLLHRTALLAHQRKWLSLPSLNRNTAFASVMLGSAMGSFLFATSTGKNEVHSLHPLFTRGARAPREAAVGLAEEQDTTAEQLKQLQKQALTSEEADRLELERNRILRRASLTRNMTAGHGLNDSHGGHWVQDKFRKE